MLTEERKLAAVHHVVHDYTNLISSGELTKAPLQPPINTHVQHAFLMNCRKMAAFFLNLRGKKEDILSIHFLRKPEKFVLSWHVDWNDAMNFQLLHLSYSRIDKAKPWDGTPNKVLLEEFRISWKRFRSCLEEPYRSKFEAEITLRLDSEFRNLDLW